MIEMEDVSNELSFTCHKCHKSFAHLSHLDQHLYIDACGEQKTVTVEFLDDGEPCDEHKTVTFELLKLCGSSEDEADSANIYANETIDHEDDGSENKNIDHNERAVIENSTEEACQPKSKNNLHKCHCGKVFKKAFTLERHLETHIEKTFKCGECKRSFVSVSDLQVHMLIHKGNDPTEDQQLTCAECETPFKSSKALKQHANIHLNSEAKMDSSSNDISDQEGISDRRQPKKMDKQQCHLCGMYVMNLSNHVARHSKLPSHKCPLCDFRSWVPTGLEKHLLTHGENNEEYYNAVLKHKKDREKKYIYDKFHCDECQKDFISKKALLIHEQRNHDSKSYKYQCDTCEKKLPSENELFVHRRNKHNNLEPVDAFDGMYPCDRCSNIYPTPMRLKQHKKLIHEPSSYTCGICSKGFKTYDTFKMHLLTHKNIKLYTCATCGKQFSQDTNLRKHELIHTGEKPFGCEVCGKFFNKSGTLFQHKRIHTKEKLFKCAICPKEFTQLVHLKGHQYTHTGEKPFKCDICEKGFSNHSNRNKHMLIHTGKKPWVCKQCGKGFANNASLKSHSWVHTGVKSFRCTVCDKEFTTNGNLTQHMRLHKGKKPYPCDKCDYAFTTASNLRKHMQRHEVDAEGMPKSKRQKSLHQPKSGKRKDKVYYQYAGVATIDKYDNDRADPVRPTQCYQIIESKDILEICTVKDNVKVEMNENEILESVEEEQDDEIIQDTELRGMKQEIVESVEFVEDVEAQQGSLEFIEALGESNDEQNMVLQGQELMQNVVIETTDAELPASDNAFYIIQTPETYSVP